jgi:hypothetical protein
MVLGMAPPLASTSMMGTRLMIANRRAPDCLPLAKNWTLGPAWELGGAYVCVRACERERGRERVSKEGSGVRCSSERGVKCHRSWKVGRVRGV